MHVELKSVHFEINDSIRECVDRKLIKLDFVKDLIVDLLFTFTKEKHGFKLEANIHFRWGNNSHISTDAFDMIQGIDVLFDKIEQKVTKEKDKVQQH